MPYDVGMSDTKPSVLAILGVAIGILVGGAIAWLGSAAIVAEVRLSASGEVVSARVTNNQITKSRRTGTTHSVRYVFDVPDGPEKVTHEDETGRDNLWASMEEEAYFEATKKKKVDVLYLPEQPTTNRPVRAAGGRFGGDQIAGLILGLLILVPCLLIFISLLRKRFARAAPSATAAA